MIIAAKAIAESPAIGVVALVFMVLLACIGTYLMGRLDLASAVSRERQAKHREVAELHTKLAAVHTEHADQLGRYASQFERLNRATGAMYAELQTERRNVAILSQRLAEYEAQRETRETLQ